VSVGVAPARLERLRVQGEKVRANLRDAVRGITMQLTMDAAPVLTVALHDPDRRLVRSQLLRQRSTVTLDGKRFVLTRAEKSGSTLVTVWEAHAVAALRTKRGPLSAAPGTVTRSEFVGRLVREVGGLRYHAEPGSLIRDTVSRGSGDDRNETSWAAILRLADEVNWRVVIEGDDTVVFGSDRWLHRRGRPLKVRENRGPVQEINWTVDGRARAAEATMVVDAQAWAIQPGRPVEVLEQGLGGGMWLVDEVAVDLFADRATVQLYRAQRALPEPKPERPDEPPAPAGTPGGQVSTGSASSSGYVWPIKYRSISSGYRTASRPTHAGIDIPAPTGTPIVAARAGTVELRSDPNGYGLYINVHHGGGTFTRYAHMSRYGASSGARVAQGQVIGYVGSTGRSTGPHLHFEVRPGGVAANPMNYLP
jgi:murein DD-endopeptidase MepM/ murein hydrolase activator NlpD